MLPTALRQCFPLVCFCGCRYLLISDHMMLLFACWKLNMHSRAHCTRDMLTLATHPPTLGHGFPCDALTPSPVPTWHDFSYRSRHVTLAVLQFCVVLKTSRDHNTYHQLAWMHSLSLSLSLQRDIVCEVCSVRELCTIHAHDQGITQTQIARVNSSWHRHARQVSGLRV